MVSFQDLHLSDPVLKAIGELGFEEPSEIQSLAIPKLLNGNQDFIGLAQTGTGKTAAFGLPLIDLIDSQEKYTQALILAPTRELGQQIAEQLAIFGKYLPKINTLAVYGGTPIVNQIQALKRPQHILIATPGRLLDLIQRKKVHLDQLKYLVLDEADEMLTMGFKQEIDRILTYTPEEKQVWLFSATMSADINRIVKKYMENPVEVRLSVKNEVNSNIAHQFAVIRQSDKMEAIARFLDVNPGLRGVVFCRTKRDTQYLADWLYHRNYRADALHGDLSQRQRDHVMGKFKENRLQVLIATDIAARGIDVNDITHVFHYTLPDDIPSYTHRSGRTARAGNSGTSISFVSSFEKSKIYRIQKELDIHFKRVPVPDVEDIYEAKMQAWSLDILQQHPNGKVDPELLEKVNLVFGNLSKEELTAKLIAFEMAKLNLGPSKDLNEPSPKNMRNGRSQNGHGQSRNNRQYASASNDNKGRSRSRKRRQSRKKR